MGGSSTLSTSATRIDALKLQSSAYGVTVAVVGGVNRVAGNLVYYTDFKATPHTSTSGSGGKGGGAKTQNTTYSYAAGVIMGVCQGPIGSIGKIWVGKQVYTGGWSAGAIATATETTTTPGSGAMTYTLAHAATLIGEPVVKCTTSGRATFNRILAAGKDYSLAAGVLTFYDTTAGAAQDWHGKSFSINYQWGTGSPDLTALQQLGLTLGNGDMTQAAPAWVSSAHSAEAVAYPGLAVVHSSSYALSDGAAVENHSFEVQGSGAYRYGSTKPDCNPAEFSVNLLTNGRYGAGLPSTAVEVVDWITYCAAAGLLMSPVLTEQQRAGDFIDQVCRLTNTAPVWSYDRLKLLPYGDTALTANGVTFTPVTTPQYDITDDVWLDQGQEDPIQWERKPPADRYNVVRVEFSDRANYYNKTIAEAKDDADIAASGLRVMPTVAAPWICDAAVARTVAQIVLQRSLLITGKGRFTLPWAYCLLEPMDLLTITDAGLGFAQLPVRITAIGETDEGDLEVEVEDWPLGAAAATAYPSQAASGFQHNYGAAPGNVATPTFFEAPVDLTTTGLEVYAAVSGGADWGGCRVWVSLDATTYREAGFVYGPSRYGTLSAAAGAGAATIAVTGLTGQLNNASAADAAALQSLCYVGGTNPEYLAYQTATLTGTGAYTLGSLTHGAYGSNALAHAAGDAFVRVDQAIAKSGPLTLDFIGRVISFKFTSFNKYGRNEQSLASVSAFTYTVTGSQAKLPPPNVAGLAAAQYQGGVQISWTPAGVPDYAYTELRTGASWAAGARIFAGNAQTYSWPWPAAGAYTIWAAHWDQLGNVSALPQNISVTVDANGLVQTVGINVGAATDVQKTEVTSEAFTFPANVGVQDRSFTDINVTNGTAAAITVEVTVTGYRQVTMPAGGSGNGSAQAWVALLNVTDNLLVASTQDFMPVQLPSIAPGTTQSFLESTCFTVSVPAGKQYSFTPKCRVTSLVGTVSPPQLTTSAYTMRVTTIKR